MNLFKHGLPTKSQQKLEIMHSDVCGPFEVRSIGGNSYFLSFTDEFSRHMWFSLFEKKSEVFSNFKKFKLLVEKQAGNTMKRLKTDSGDEYTSPEFAKFCEKKVIKYEVITPYTPQHNGIVESKN